MSSQDQLREKSTPCRASLLAAIVLPLASEQEDHSLSFDRNNIYLRKFNGQNEKHPVYARM